MSMKQGMGLSQSYLQNLLWALRFRGKDRRQPGQITRDCFCGFTLCRRQGAHKREDWPTGPLMKMHNRSFLIEQKGFWRACNCWASGEEGYQPSLLHYLLQPGLLVVSVQRESNASKLRNTVNRLNNPKEGIGLKCIGFSPLPPTNLGAALGRS